MTFPELTYCTKGPLDSEVISVKIVKLPSHAQNPTTAEWTKVHNWGRGYVRILDNALVRSGLIFGITGTVLNWMGPHFAPARLSGQRA